MSDDHREGPGVIGTGQMYGGEPLAIDGVQRQPLSRQRRRGRGHSAILA
jgi:hypothetical protein